MDKDKTIKAFKCCIYITDDGDMDSDCKNCPLHYTDGRVCCKEFNDLAVWVPWQLASDILEIAEGKREV